MEAAARDFRGLGVSLANGRLEGPNKRGLCAGKGAAMSVLEAAAF